MLKFGFNGLVIISVGAGGAVAQNPGLGHFTYKHHVAAQILLGQNLAGEHGIGIFRHIKKAIMAPLGRREGTEFIRVTAGLHTEIADSLKGHSLCQYADIENAGIFDHLPRQISHLHRDRQLGGIIAHLEAGIGNAAVVFFLIPGA